MHDEKDNTADREIKVSRLLNAPISLVWEVWTNPDHLKNWWGPNGFTNTITGMTVEPDGEFNLTMHGPDGKNYKNTSVYMEVEKEKKIVYRHTSYPQFIATIEFEKRDDKTFLTWHMLFETKEVFESVVKQFKADEGLKQNIEKLEIYLQSRKKATL
jgi:uncharacterized protein YndB with AHSA1/START domain